MSTLIATKRVDLLAPYMALDQGKAVQAECEFLIRSGHATRIEPPIGMPADATFRRLD